MFVRIFFFFISDPPRGIDRRFSEDRFEKNSSEFFDWMLMSQRAFGSSPASSLMRLGNPKNIISLKEHV
jgi:hypothetical protein